ncbi:MAG: DoxX family protein [Castellaniella sp.]|nr:MAG: DoxX family protein [Castellaniella sp.]
MARGSSWGDAADLVGRVLLTAFFIIFGFLKITGYAGFAKYMESKGVPSVLLPLVIATELGCGFALLLGWRTRVAAFLLAGFALLSNLIFHPALSDMTGQIIVLAELATAGGLLVLTAHGAGGWSLDARRTAQQSVLTVSGANAYATTSHS